MRTLGFRQRADPKESEREQSYHYNIGCDDLPHLDSHPFFTCRQRRHSYLRADFRVFVAAATEVVVAGLQLRDSNTIGQQVDTDMRHFFCCR